MSFPDHPPSPRRLVRLGGLALLLLAVVVVAVAPSASASLLGLRSGEGLLTVSTSPAVATQISVGDTARNTTRITGLPLPAGEHVVCFEGPEGYLAPGCETVKITEDELTSLTGEFEPVGMLKVEVEPAQLQPEITVDDVARDRGPTRLPLTEGTHEVCFEELDGYEALDCQQLDVEAGQDHQLVVAYQPTAELKPAPYATDVRITSAVRHNQRGSQWNAEAGITATVDDEPAAGVPVEIAWSAGSSSASSCVTDSQGGCNFARTGIHNRDDPVTFTVVRVDGEPVTGTSVEISR
jgi:hypothetical protein